MKKNLCKKPKNIFSRYKNDENFSMKKSMKIEKSKISIFLKKCRHFGFFDFHWLFHRKKIDIFLISKKYFCFFAQIFFSFWKNIFSNLFFTISIRNFPKIPKIVLRKLREQGKNTKSTKCQVFVQILTDFRDMLRITTLNPLAVGCSKFGATTGI